MSNKLWPILLSILLVLGVVFYASKEVNKIKYDYEAQAKALRELHQTELDKINEARATEKAQLQENLVQLQKKLDDNKKEYEQKLADLIAKKNRESAELSKKAPVDLAEDVSAATGFKVYRPGK